jgi:hypothetical protein
MTLFMNLKHLAERSEEYFRATISYASAAFNLVIRLFGSFAKLSL